jgi:hypothetical protein
MSRLPLSSEIRDAIYYYTLGATVNYDGDAGQDTHRNNYNRTNPTMVAQFEWLFQRVLKLLEENLGRGKAYLYPNTNLCFRIMSGEILRNPIARLIVSRLPVSPHIDMQYKHLKWPEGACMSEGISFTLCIDLPKESVGSGLRIWDRYQEQKSGLIYASSGEEVLTRFDSWESWPYEDLEYTPGFITILSGCQYHAINRPKKMRQDDWRITLQGHALYSEGQWWVFG